MALRKSFVSMNLLLLLLVSIHILRSKFNGIQNYVKISSKLTAPSSEHSSEFGFIKYTEEHSRGLRLGMRTHNDNDDDDDDGSELNDLLMLGYCF